MAKNEKPSKPALPEKKEWVLLKKSIVHYWDTLADTYHELRKESDLFNELTLYIPFICAMLFFYYTNRIAFFYHNFGNYGLEENFIASTVPLIKDLLSGHFSRLSLGLDGPLYPLMLALKAVVFPRTDILKSALFLNVIFGTASLLASYYLIKEVFNLKTAVISLILIATNIAYFEFTYTAGAGAAFFFFTVSTLFLLFKNHGDFSRRNAMVLFLCGVTAALSALTNLLGLFLLVFVPLSIAYFGVAGKDRNTRIKTSLAFILGFLAVFVPATLFIKLKGTVFITPLPLLEKAQGSLFLIHLKNLYFRLFADIGELIGWTIGAFVTLGILVMVLSENTRRQLAYMSLGILLFIGLGFLQHNRFYAFILLLFFIPLAANIFGSGVYKRILDKRVALGLLVIFLVLLCVNVYRNLNSIGNMSQGEPKHLLAMARYFREHPETKGPVVSQRPLLPRRLSMEHIPIDAKIDNMTSLLNYAREKKAKYLLADFPEYNTCPYLRFLSLPEMKNPLGLREIVRKDYSALYAFDFDAVDKAPVFAYTAGPVRAFLQSGALRLPPEVSPDSIAAYIRSTFRVKDLSKLSQPAYQMVSQYKMKGYELYGVILRGIFNEIITANIYAPEDAGASALMDKSRKPSVLILSGEDKEGKGSLLARNFAENLVHSGFFVIVMDAPGTGERVGPYSSLNTFMLYQSASGFSPAELFVTEAILAGNLFGILPQARSDAIHLLAIGDDAYTALYTALLDTSVKSLTFAGGLLPFGDLALQGYRPVKAQVNGIAGRYSFKAVLNAVKARVKNIQCLSTNVMMNPLVESYGFEYGFRAFPLRNDQDFVKESFSKGIETLCAFAGNGTITPAAVQFRGYNDQEKSMSLTIGDQAVVQNSPPLIEVFARPGEKPARLAPLAASGDETVIIRGILPLSSENGFGRKKILCADKSGMPVEWTEMKSASSRQGKVLLTLTPGDSSKPDSALFALALMKGYTLCRVSLMPDVSSYPDAMRNYYDNLLFGINSRERLRASLGVIKSYYHALPGLLCLDSLSAMAGLALVSQDSLVVKQLILRNFMSGRPDALYGDIYDGFDGNLNASGEYVNLHNLAVSLLIRDFGDESAEDAFDGITVRKIPVVLYYPVREDAPSDNAYGEKVKITSAPDSLFSGE